MTLGSAGKRRFACSYRRQTVEGAALFEESILAAHALTSVATIWKWSATLLVLITPLLVGGCAGYQLGNRTLYPADVRTVHVPIFASDSFRRNLGERLTEAVVKEIERTTPYKVVGADHADSVLEGRITGVRKRVVAENRFDDPRELEIDFAVQVSWSDHRNRSLCEPCTVELPPELTVVGASSTLVPEVGQSVVTAQQQAIERLATQIVSMMEAPW